MKRSHLVILVVLLVLIIDQFSKIWIKTHFTYGQEIHILGLDWARIHFIENDGMAFGWSFGGSTGKLILTVFRIVAVGVLFYIIRSMVVQKEAKGLILCFSLILAGALGNILDSVLYGYLFTESGYAQLARWWPGHGTGRGLLYGKVVDMLYFPMFDFILPDWIPFRGGTRFQFFKPVFNIADSSIFLGVSGLLLFFRSYFFSNKPKENSEN